MHRFIHSLNSLYLALVSLFPDSAWIPEARKLLACFALWLTVVPSAQFLQAQTSVVTWQNYHVQFLDNNGNPLASGCVFTFAAGTSTPQATYTDSAGLVPNANPIILDAGGFADIWLGGSAYKFTVKSFGGTACASGSQIWSRDNITTSALINAIVKNPSGTQTIAGNFILNIAGSLNACRTDGVRLVDAANTCGWSGSDVGGWLNSAYADLPSSGGKIWVGCAVYNFSTPILFNTLNKYVSAEALCQATSFSLTGVVLNYTPTTATKAITLDFSSTSGGQPPFEVFKGIALTNNGCATAAGCGSLASGIAIGTTNGGCAKCTFSELDVEGFNIGFDVPAGAAGVGWGMAFIRFNFAYNATAFSGLNTSGMENLNFISGTFIVNGTAINTKGEVYAAAVSFDGNTITAVNLPNNGLITPGPDFSCFGCHFENLNGPAIPHYITGTGNYVLYGGIIEDDTSTVHTIDYMLQAQGAWVKISGVQAVINQTAANTTITSLVFAGANTRGRVELIIGGNPTFPVTRIGGTTAGITDTSYTQNTSNPETPWKLEPTLLAPVGIGDAAFTPSVAAALHIKANTATYDLLCLEDSGATPRKVCIGPGTGTSAGFGIRDNTGGKQLAAFSWTDQSFSLFGSTSGSTKILAAAIASGSITLPAATGKVLITGSGANNILQSVRGVAGCATGASIGATCSTTVTWTNAFADANYTVIGCMGTGITSGLPILQLYGTKLAASIAVQTMALTAAAAQFTTLECTAVHD